MAKEYKVWIEIEEIDEDEDCYVDADIFEAGRFDTLEEAVNFANSLI